MRATKQSERVRVGVTVDLRQDDVGKLSNQLDIVFVVVMISLTRFKEGPERISLEETGRNVAKDNDSALLQSRVLELGP